MPITQKIQFFCIKAFEQQTRGSKKFDHLWNVTYVWLTPKIFKKNFAFLEPQQIYSHIIPKFLHKYQRYYSFKKLQKMKASVAIEEKLQKKIQKQKKTEEKKKLFKR